MNLMVLFYGAGASQLLPVIAILAVWGHRPPPQYLRLAAFSAFMGFGFFLDLIASHWLHNNLWVWYVTLPIETGLTLWVLAGWQLSERLKSLYYAAIPVEVALIAALLVLTDPALTFELWVVPGMSLLMLGACLHTLTHRSLASREPLPSQDWFWVVLGMALVWVSSVAVTAFSWAIGSNHKPWVVWAYFGRASVLLPAYASITWGVLCPRLQARSHGLS